MLKSMTGFARVASQDGAEFLQWEIRSVNHRYLDISFRMPEEFRAIEVKLRKLAGEFLARGKVECYLTFLSEEAGDYELKVNAGLVQALNKAQAEIQTITQQKAALSMGALMNWPNVIHKSKSNDEHKLKLAQDCFEKALQRLVEHRKQEGAALNEVILDKLEQLSMFQQQAKIKFHEAQGLIEQQLQQKIEHLKVEVDRSRFEQELVYLLNKMDVMEELDRLAAHIDDLKRSLKSSVAVGRKLDFSLQEFNREANTLASKSPSTELSQISVEMKVLIEQIREQIQNIE